MVVMMMVRTLRLLALRGQLAGLERRRAARLRRRFELTRKVLKELLFRTCRLLRGRAQLGRDLRCQRFEFRRICLRQAVQLAQELTGLRQARRAIRLETAEQTRRRAAGGARHAGVCRAVHLRQPLEGRVIGVDGLK